MSYLPTTNNAPPVYIHNGASRVYSLAGTAAAAVGSYPIVNSGSINITALVKGTTGNDYFLTAAQGDAGLSVSFDGVTITINLSTVPAENTAGAVVDLINNNFDNFVATLVGDDGTGLIEVCACGQPHQFAGGFDGSEVVFELPAGKVSIQLLVDPTTEHCALFRIKDSPYKDYPHISNTNGAMWSGNVVELIVTQDNPIYFYLSLYNAARTAVIAGGAGDVVIVNCEVPNV